MEEWVALRPILEVCDKETGYKVRGGALVEENDDQEADECYIKRYFGGGKGADLEIRKAWRGRGRQGSSRFGFRCRDRLASGDLYICHNSPIQVRCKRGSAEMV